MNIRKFYPLLAILAFSGCTSVTSTMLNRTEADNFVGNSNGHPKKHCDARPFKGVPITLRVPTHVDIAIVEKVRLSLDSKSRELHRLDSTHRHLSVATNLIYTDKVFTVDVKRPAAGTANYTLEFGGATDDLDNRQYFKNIKSRIVDETIKDVTSAINTVFNALPASTEDAGAKFITDGTVTFFEQTRTVAWKRFDVDAVDFEAQVAAFVELHMNSCNTCLEYTAADVNAVPVSAAVTDPTFSPASTSAVSAASEYFQ